MSEKYEPLVKRLRTLSNYSSVQFNDRVERGDCNDAANAIEALVQDVVRYKEELFLSTRHIRLLEDELKQLRRSGPIEFSPECAADTGALSGLTAFVRQIQTDS